MNTYLLLLHASTTAVPDMSPEEMQAVVAKYKQWGQKLHESGRYLAGNKLEDGTGRILSGTTQVHITDGPFAETKDVIGGYYLVQAANWDEAAELSRDCPHLQFGGTIEIRRIEAV